jgi:hypothetical protein
LISVEDDKEVYFLRKIEVGFDGFGIYRFEINLEVELLDEGLKGLNLCVK